jgi:hypothetical protein
VFSPLLRCASGHAPVPAPARSIAQLALLMMVCESGIAAYAGEANAYSLVSPY